MDITPEIVAEFRTNYSQFSNVTTWPDSIVTQALCEADVVTGSSRWGAYQNECHNIKQIGMFLYAAHWLSVYYPKGGDMPPDPNPKWGWDSKTVRSQSISYATGSGKISPEDAWLFSSVFGQQYYTWMRIVGLGGVAV